MKFNKLILILVFLVLFCNFVKADLRFDEILCSKEGSLYLSVYSEDSKISVDDVKVIAKLKGDFNLVTSTFEINGTWDKEEINDRGISFNTDYPQIIEAGKYDVVLEYIDEGITQESSYEITCPGLIFSCELIKVSIKNCTIIDNKYFNLLVELSGMEQSKARKIDLFEDIKYNLVAEDSYKDFRGLFSKKGSLPENVKVDKLDENLYLFSSEITYNKIKSVNIYLKSLQNECRDKDLYDFKECLDIVTEEPEENLNETKENIKEISKITGDVIKVNEAKGFNTSYLIYILIFIIILIAIIVYFKKQKVNKWV